MNRCVDLDERVTTQFYDQEYEEWTMQTVTIKDVLDSVCDEYTILPSAQLDQRWTPGDKPLEEGSYLVWMPFASPKHKMIVAEYYGEYWNIKTPISAWMPLPEPYKEGK